MKKIIFLFAVLATVAMAGEHSSITIRAPSMATNTTTIVTNAFPISGKVVSMSLGAAGGSATATVYTVSNIGSSHGTAKTIQAATVVTAAGSVTNYGASTFLAEDYVVARFDNATATSSVIPVITMIYEK